MPSDVLYSLNKDMPKSHLLRKFLSIQKRIKMLNECASKWDKDVASILSINTKVDKKETCSKEKFENIVAMSKYEFLSKVC